MEKLRKLRELAEKYGTSIEDLPVVLRKMKSEMREIEEKMRMMS